MSDTPKTQAEIDELKARWLNDQSWDLPSTPGFSLHREELAGYQAVYEGHHTNVKLVQLIEEAKRLGIDHRDLVRARELEAKSSTALQRAIAALRGQFSRLGIVDNAAVTTALTELYTAAVAQAKAEIIKESGK